MRKRFDGCSAAGSIPTCVGDDSGGDAEGDPGSAAVGSTSIATCVVDGDVGGARGSAVTSIATCVANGVVGDARGSAVTSIATCVANGVVVVTAAATCVGGGSAVATGGELGSPLTTTFWKWAGQLTSMPEVSHWAGVCEDGGPEGIGAVVVGTQSVGSWSLATRP